jgi:hypothetical protein
VVDLVALQMAVMVALVAVFLSQVDMVRTLELELLDKATMVDTVAVVLAIAVVAVAAVQGQ